MPKVLTRDNKSFKTLPKASLKSRNIPLLHLLKMIIYSLLIHPKSKKNIRASSKKGTITYNKYTVVLASLANLGKVLFYVVGGLYIKVVYTWWLQVPWAISVYGIILNSPKFWLNSKIVLMIYKTKLTLKANKCFSNIAWELLYCKVYIMERK